MPAASEASVREMLAASLHEDGGVDDLKPFWTPITRRATAQAEAEIRDILSGFPAATVAKWGLFESKHIQLALFWCGVYGASELTDDQRNLLRLMDCREELRALETLGPDDPDTTADDAVLSGRMERADDTFALPSVNCDGSLPASVFKAERIWSGRHWR